MAEEFIRHLLLQVFFSLFYAPDKDLYPHEVVVTEDSFIKATYALLLTRSILRFPSNDNYIFPMQCVSELSIYIN